MDEELVTVLLVDDDPGFSSIVKHRLVPFQNRRFEVICDDKGENILKHLRENAAINLVLMDFYLQQQNGLEIIKQLHEEGISIPVVFLTSNKDFRTAIEAMKFGVEDYLLKDDIGDTVLPRTILNALDRFSLRRKIEEAEKQKLFSQKKTEAIQEIVVTICHEFNNPLAAIKITTSILARQQLSDEEKTLLGKLNLSVSLLEQQIKKLRDLNTEYPLPLSS